MECPTQNLFVRKTHKNLLFTAVGSTSELELQINHDILIIAQFSTVFCSYFLHLTTVRLALEIYQVLGHQLGSNGKLLLWFTPLNTF